MKAIVFAALLVLAVSCKKKEDSAPVEVVPSPSPVATPAPVDSCPQKQSGMYTCYDWKPCNGLFPKFEDAVAALNKYDAPGCGKIDDVVVKNGFGPCSECFSVKGDGSVEPTVHSFEEILKIRRNLKAQGVQLYFQKN